VGGEVHVRFRHAVGPPQVALDTVDARGAGHALDVEGDEDRFLR
jgi:hypothetical protein